MQCFFVPEAIENMMINENKTQNFNDFINLQISKTVMITPTNWMMCYFQRNYGHVDNSSVPFWDSRCWGHSCWGGVDNRLSLMFRV